MILQNLMSFASLAAATLIPTPSPTFIGITRRQLAITAISECQIESSAQFCHAGTTTVAVLTSGTVNLPSSYTDCHAHGTATYCISGESEVQVSVVASTTETALRTTAAAASSALETVTAVTAVSDCHLHGTQLYCVAGTAEYIVAVTVTQTTDIPAAYTGCHTHSSSLYCVDETGEDVALTAETESVTENTSDSESGEAEMDCHFHAGVEHCVAKGGSEVLSSASCERNDRNYNIPLRIGFLFVILATSAIGVFAPIFLQKYLPNQLGAFFVVLKQFGTGIIISTALVHLLTHATLMFENECLGVLKYEATATSIMMAGIFVSFIVEYLGHCYLNTCQAKAIPTLPAFPPYYGSPATANELINITVMEAGIIFHSLIIGLTLVVTGDSAFMTLFIVIIFHQMFEGIALGSRIATLGTDRLSVLNSLSHHHGSPGSHLHPHTPTQPPPQPPMATTSTTTTTTFTPPYPIPPPVPLRIKLLMASLFALITPIGMAIGIGVLSHFNGNSPGTIIAIGVLDAFSAGILMWVGLVEMWAADWMHGEYAGARATKAGLGLVGLMAGMIAMSVLGKWA